MKSDIFLSICQTEVDGHTPSERQMFLNFFDQVRLADELGFGTAWVAETHLSCQVQKQNPDAVIPHFKGEIGLNTDILQMAHMVFSQTKKINVGSAIRNILCNGGPIAHAEAVRTFLSLHGLNAKETRKLELGFAAGRFPFSNTPYGIKPRSEFEKLTWDVLKNKIFNQATEIFLRFLKGEKFSINEVSPMKLRQKDFRSLELWQKAYDFAKSEKSQLYKVLGEEIEVSSFYDFGQVGVIPFEAPLENLRLTIGSHDPEVQIMANKHLPVGVFNLSITPPEIIEETHKRMAEHYHASGGSWRRDLMPRTVLLFIDDTEGFSDEQKMTKAKDQAEKAWRNYWLAMEKTLDPKKVEGAVSNTIYGHPKAVTEQIMAKYHPEDRLMLWFDFNNHDSEAVKNSMRAYMQKVAPNLPS